MKNLNFYHYLEKLSNNVLVKANILLLLLLLVTMHSFSQTPFETTYSSPTAFSHQHYSIVTTPNNTNVMAGTMTGPGVDLAHIMEIDNVTGAILWENTFPFGTGGGKIFDVTTGSNGYVMTGYYTLNGVDKLFTLAVDFLGAYVTDHVYNVLTVPNMNIYGFEIIEASNGDYIVVGTASNSPLINGSVVPFNDVPKKAIIVRLDSALNYVFNRTFESNTIAPYYPKDYDMFSCVLELNTGEIVVAGSKNETLPSCSNPVLIPAIGDQEVSIIKLNSTFNIIWDKGFTVTNCGGHLDLAADLEYDAVNNSILALCNYSISHSFGIIAVDPATGAQIPSQSWRVNGIGSSFFNSPGFDLEIGSAANGYITGMYLDGFFTNCNDAAVTVSGANTFVYHFETTNGNKINDQIYPLSSTYALSSTDVFDPFIFQQPWFKAAKISTLKNADQDLSLVGYEFNGAGFDLKTYNVDEANLEAECCSEPALITSQPFTYLEDDSIFISLTYTLNSFQAVSSVNLGHTYLPCETDDCDPCKPDWVVAEPNPNSAIVDSCCYRLDIDNDCDDLMTGVRITSISAGVNFGSHSNPNYGSSWNYFVVDPQTVLWSPNTAPAPAGLYNDLMFFCLDNISGDPAPQILVEYLGATLTGAELVVCDTVITLSCPQPPFPCDSCDLVQDFLCDTIFGTPFIGLYDISTIDSPCNILQIEWIELVGGVYSSLGTGPAVNVIIDPNATEICQVITYAANNLSVCRDTLCKPIPDDCCQGTYNDFLVDHVNPGFSIFQTAVNCYLMAFVPNALDSCHQVFFDWGDGSALSPIGPPGSFTHIFPGDGIYTVCMYVVELDAAGNVCFQGVYCEDIVIDCDGCCQGTQADFEADHLNFNLFYGINCGSVGLTVPNADTCQQYTVDWGDGNISGPISSPFLSPVHTYTTDGTYIICMYLEEIDPLTGAVCFSGTVCDTIIIDCDPDCCDGTINDFFNDHVNPGFTTSSTAADCHTLSFTPNALDSCHQVTFDFGDGSPVAIPGPTGTFTHTFPSSGIYTVCMYVVEYDAAGNICFSGTYCEDITIDCDGCCQGTQAEFEADHLHFNIFYGIACGGVGVSPTDIDSCQQFTIDWGDGTTTGPVSPPFFTPLHNYTTDGTYILCMYVEEIDPITNVVCFSGTVCDTIIIDCDPDCCDGTYDQFLFDHVDPGYTTSQLAADCHTVAFTPNALDSCHQVTYDWGDGSPIMVPGPTGTSVHTFPTSGVYNVCMYVIELDDSGNVCFQGVYCEDIIIDCDGCCEGTQSQFEADHLYFNIYYGITCSGVALSIPDVDTCQQFTIDWGDGTTTGPVSAPFFSPAHNYTADGTYIICMYLEEIDPLTGNVCFSGTVCDTVIIDCDPDCCDGTNTDFIIDHVNPGFTISQLSIDCHTLSFTPNALDSCHQVTFDWGDGSPIMIPGPTGTFTHTFPGDGIYTVCMYVTEIDASGNVCFQGIYCEDITIDCDADCCDGTYSEFLNDHVNPGFSLITSISNCNTIAATPNALDSCHLVSFDWGDGNITTPGPTGTYTHSYTSNGTYVICMTVVELDASGNICFQGSYCETITINCGLPCDSCDLDQEFLCTSSPVFGGITLTDNSTVTNPCSIINVDWYEIIGGVYSYLGSGSPYNAILTGTYPLEICEVITYGTSNGSFCQDTLCKIIEGPDCDDCIGFFGFTPGPSPAGATVVFTNDSYVDLPCTILGYLWDFGDGGTSTLENPSHTYTAGGVYKVTLTVIYQNPIGQVTCTEVVCRYIQVPNIIVWDPCDFVIDLGTNTIYADLIKADLIIITSGTSPSGDNVTLQAGNVVELLPGFEAEVGTNFSATIDTCTN